MLGDAASQISMRLRLKLARIASDGFATPTISRGARIVMAECVRSKVGASCARRASEQVALATPMASYNLQAQIAMLSLPRIVLQESD